MPMKPTKRGYKVWCRCSPNGLMSDCGIYGGSLAQTRETNLSSSVVLKLAGFIANKGHHLFLDNYFSSVQLCRDSLRMKTYSCGTARSNRKEFPSSLKNPVLQRGQHQSQFVANIQCFVWKDKKNDTSYRASVSLMSRDKCSGRTRTDLEYQLNAPYQLNSTINTWVE